MARSMLFSKSQHFKKNSKLDSDVEKYFSFRNWNKRTACNNLPEFLSIVLVVPDNIFSHLAALHFKDTLKYTTEEIQ